MTESSDEALFRAFVDGNGRSFDKLYQRYRRRIFTFVLRSTRNRSEAEELLQEVFAKVVDRADGFRGEAKFSTWLYAIARNACVDHSRRMAHRRHRSLDVQQSGTGTGTPWVERIAADAPSPDREAARPGLRARIATAIDALPDDQREVFLLKQIEGLTFKEIAQVVEAPLNTVKSRMRYALERLQLALSEFDERTDKEATDAL